MRARLAAHKSWAHTENRATRAVSSSQGSNRDPPPETKRSETPRSHETRSFEWSRGGTHVPGRRPWTGGLLLTAGSITLQNGACLVVPTPTNKHRHGARQRSHHPDDSGGSTIPGTHPSSLGNLGGCPEPTIIGARMCRRRRPGRVSSAPSIGVISPCPAGGCGRTTLSSRPTPS